MPYSRRAKYYHFRQKHPDLFINGTIKTVPLNHTAYRGKKFKKWNKSGTTAKAITGKLRKTKKASIQSILIIKSEWKRKRKK